jgi:membrane protease YdiL (CAAX protease family)
MAHKRILREVVIFYLFASSLAWLVWFPLYLKASGLRFMNHDPVYLISIGALVPSVVAVINVGRSDRKKGVIAFLKKGLQFGFPRRVWLILFIVPFAAAVSMLAALSQCTAKVPQPLIDRPWLIAVLFPVILLFGGPLGAEYGWRGYALDRLMKMMDPFFAALVVGVLWAVWQLPLFFIKGTVQNQTSFVGFFMVTLLLSIIMTIAYVRSSGSVGLSIIFHTVTTLSYGVFSIFLSNCRGVVFLIVLAALTLALIIIDRRTLFPSERKRFR